MITQLTYIVAGALFILSLRLMNSPVGARKGVFCGIAAMVLAVGGTMLSPSVDRFVWIAVAMVLGTIVGIPLAAVPITAVPQRTALSHAFGALAATLVGVGKFFVFSHAELTPFISGAIVFEVLLGGVTFTGSIIAALKLQEVISGRPITYPGQNLVNLSVLAGAIICGIWLVIDPTQTWAFVAVVALALLFGIMLVLPIGGADMPTVISLLNSYAGLSAVAMGFVLNNHLLIIAGALDGASGLILSIIMCKAMNRSFTNVLFGAFGQVQKAAAGDAGEKVHREVSAEEAAEYLKEAQKVVIVPGYGMAVAQAQHKVRELFDLLTKRDIDVKFAIHPVAGRMPGHMNVLLAEADIPYDNLIEMDEINPEMPQVDIVIVIGANDVVNPAAKTNPGSPIFGMPVIEVDKAKQIIFMKRGLATGFAGVENELFYNPKTMMLFGSAKETVGHLAAELKKN
ncbi:MAG TPA: NAD(P)(+) transhydrogenase (Re/Si-specific) subunit beta [Candidatus Omnitrophota bacterium]|nr:NAD(P)(+) transhydrogenase (Re/Si-specific) subunit beta [Candidatus Omnitrophota bacterium]